MNILWFSEPISTYVLRQREAWRQTSLGPIVGTNIFRGSIGDELFAGIDIGHALGDAGIVVAADWLAEPEIINGHVENPRKRRLLFGIYLPF